MRHSYQSATLLALILATSACEADNQAVDNPYAEPDTPGLPPSNMELDLPRTAVVVTDPQIDFLSEDGQSPCEIYTQSIGNLTAFASQRQANCSLLSYA